MERAQNIQLNVLAGWYTDHTREISQPIEENSQKLVNRVREAFSLIEDSSKRIILTSKSLIEIEREAARYAQRLAGNVSFSLKRVNFPDKISYETLQLLHENLQEVIDSISEAGRRCLPRMSPFFKDEVRSLDFAVKKLAREMEDLHDFLQTDYVEVKRVEDVRGTIDDLIIQVKRREEMQRSIENVQERIREMEREMSEKLSRLEELHDEERFKRIIEMESELKDITRTFFRIFNPLKKPMKKMAKLVHDGEYALEGEKRLILDGFLVNQFDRFVSLRNHEQLETFLSELKGLIETGKLQLKKSRKEKALRCLQGSIKIESLERMRKKYIELEGEMERIKHSLNRNGIRSAREKTRNRIDKLTLEIRRLKKHLQKMQKDHIRLREESEQYKKLAENSIASIVNEEIEILLEPNV